MYRKAAGLTLATAARAFKVNISTVHRWERGESEPRPEAIQAIAQAYQIAPLDIVKLFSGPQRFNGKAA
jgi:transcriptional regulator with XRE-family HTH domain